MTIQWFPGHMAKAYRAIRENLKLVDVVIELLDARIPSSSSNPVIEELIEDKPKVIVLNKSDLAEKAITGEWIKHFNKIQVPAVAVDAAGGKGIKELVSLVERTASEKLKSLAVKGIKRSVRAMILGIPNVGKSSLINRLVGGSVTKTGDKPGITKAMQWIRIGKNIELLDTPGVLWPKFEDLDAAYRLAVTGAINDDIYDMEKVICFLLTLLNLKYKDRLIKRYNFNGPLPEESEKILEQIAMRRGCLRAGGIIDFEKAFRIVLNEFRAGKLGLFSLDKP